ncbi:alpha-amylase family glycosyl hydrolase [Methylomonas sp. CM2]|uniref:alpha-amylase family glycosyl hydrolase n=1 Tax=Methylomonas sp. CM2 TaxID=3417647 RepID=UPI003CE9CF5C
MSESRLADVDLSQLTSNVVFNPSPTAWEDKLLYFLMLDRFSDGNESGGFRDAAGKPVAGGTTPLAQTADKRNAIQTPAAAAKWSDAGGKYVGGTLAGLKSKLGYLKRLGVTAIWISPIFKQVAFQETYHGYGIQDFLQVNPRFGTNQALKDLVAAAHQQGILVILDIILNHSGNVFSYDPKRQPNYKDGNGNFDPRWDGGHYPVTGFNDAAGQANIPFVTANPAAPATWPAKDGAIWPVEFQNPEYFTRKGRISSFDYDPEFREGDFFDLKDLHHGFGGTDDFAPAPGLLALIEVYKYWIAYADLDGFRIDTVKHMQDGATRIFGSAIHEFAQSIGKDNFLLVGEITGGRYRAFDTLEATGLDAALGIDDIPSKLEAMVKGSGNPNDYFSLFRNSLLLGKDSHTWFRNKVVTMFNDHDQVGRAKARFCADADKAELVLNALAVNALTLGIPCVYYGTEQGFDGHGGDSDRYIREAMFGGEFGAFESRGVHYFDENHPVYSEFAKLMAIRAAQPALRRGRQYLRPISGDGQNFGLPTMLGGKLLSLVPWSRILADHEVVVAINTDPNAAKTVWVTIDAALHRPGEKLTCLYSTDSAQIGTTADIQPKNGLAVRLTAPAAGLVIYR